MRVRLPEMEQLRGRRPRVHGNGFLQLDLNHDGSRRLHVWHDALPRQSTPSSIHDHVFTLRSTVICGTLHHIEYDAYPDVEGHWEVYRAEQVGPGNNTELRPEEGYVSLQEIARDVLTAGSTYDFPAFKLHDTAHEGLTATIMEKIAAPTGYGRPRVLCRADSKPDNDFDREGFDPDILWPFVSMALDEAQHIRLQSYTDWAAQAAPGETGVERIDYP